MTTPGAFGQYLDETGRRRVERIVDGMTVPELVGQMVGAPPREDADRLRTELREHHIGSIHFGGTPYNTPTAKAGFLNEMQDVSIESSRFDVPLLVRAMAEHGHAAVAGSTVFPQQLGLAAARDPDLVTEAARIAATEMRATGTHATSSPIGDVARDARWGRIAETFSESPVLAAALTAAMVRGYQNGSVPDEEAVFAVTKHFPAYSEGVRGEDQAPNEISEYLLRLVHLPPYAAGIEAGTAGIMPCYNAIEGEPVHGSRRYLGELLRGELGFDGFVLADYAGAEDLHGGHGTSASLAESLWQSVRAGVDLFPSGGAAYAERLVALVEDGELSAERIEESARRILRLKARLGLFEDRAVDAEAAAETLGCESHREVARRCVRESATLLKNEGGVLPLSADLDEILVTGPNADSLPAQHGGWGTVADPEPLGETLLEGIRAVAGPETAVTHEPGAGIEEPRDAATARDAAAEADAAVVVLGEPDYVHEFRGSSHEVNAEDFPARTRLTLPDAQTDLARAVQETGTPTVVVLVTGRILATPGLAEAIPALLLAYQPGSEGRAVAEVLFGESDPGGRLPVSVPRSAGHLPVRFNRLDHPTAGHDAHVDSYDPLFEYGHGLSYTDFEYGDLSLSAAEVGPDEPIEASIPVTNVGDRPGREVVEAFVADEVSSRVTPVRELGGFEGVRLDPGETTTVAFAIRPAEHGVVGPDGDRRAEPGSYAVTVGEQQETFEVVRRRPYSRGE
jgi:beta-glucosidase